MNAERVAVASPPLPFWCLYWIGVGAFGAVVLCMNFESNTLLQHISVVVLCRGLLDVFSDTRRAAKH